MCCLVGAIPALVVPLHVKSQMVRPGETSGDTEEVGGGKDSSVSQTCLGDTTGILNIHVLKEKKK